MNETTHGSASPLPEGRADGRAQRLAVPEAGERSSEEVGAFCWLFTALGHGGDLNLPETWSIHQPTAEKALRLLAEYGWRLEYVGPDEGVMVIIDGVVRSW